MSLLGKIVKGEMKAAKPLATTALAATPAGRVVAAVGTVAGAVAGARKALPALRSLPGAGAVVAAAGGAGGRIGGVVRAIGKGAGAAATGYAIYDAAGNLIGHQRKKGRRMNPMNYRALKRAARRIKAARKFVKLIDSVGHPKARHHFSRSK